MGQPKQNLSTLSETESETGRERVRQREPESETESERERERESICPCITLSNEKRPVCFIAVTDLLAQSILLHLQWG